VPTAHRSRRTNPGPGHRASDRCAPNTGGLDLAVHAVLGETLAWYAETDRHARTVLAHRFGGVDNLGDIRAVDWTPVAPVDIVTAGFPSPDISDAGKREGIGGAQSSL
jgi:DNA (cytosine-5)-methyltransferase 1